jgi:rhamnosyltransferase
MTAVAARNELVSRYDVAALVVTYLPDAGLAERLNSLLAQFGRVALVDNGSSDEALSAIGPQIDGSNVSLLRNPTNLGIATALNQGVRLLAGEGFGWVVTFDQDSEIQPGFLAAQLATLSSQENSGNVAMIGANRIDPDSEGNHRWLRSRRSFPFFERVNCEETSLGVTLVITSGTMTNVVIFNKLGGYRDELFIDLVDSEYCLRALQRGYVVLVSCAAKLTHKVGDKTQRKVLGMTLSSTHHSPLRRYYLFRNCVHLIKRYGGVRPHWLIYQIVALCEVILGIIVSESQKGRKLRACVAGIRDGLAGKYGPAPDGVVR